MIIGGVQGYKMPHKLILIISTSIIGGFLTVRGISFVGGGFPSESLILDILNSQEYEQIPHFLTSTVYFYLAAWVVFSVGAIMFQLWHNKDLKESDLTYRNKDDDEDRYFSEDK